MRSPLQQFMDLLPARPLLVGTVVDVTAGMATVELPGGGQVKARGEAAIDDRVWLRDGVIEGPAPDLTFVSADV